MIGKTFFTKEAGNTSALQVVVKGEWTEGKWFCRTEDEEAKVVIRTPAQLVSTKLLAKKVKL